MARRLFRVSIHGMIALGLVSLGDPLAAQWRIAGEPGKATVAATPAEGLLTGLALVCEKNKAFLSLGLKRRPQNDPARVIVSVDGVDFPLVLTRFGSDTTFAGDLPDIKLIGAMRSGRLVVVRIEGQHFGTASLAGSAAPIAQAMAGCWLDETEGAARAQELPVEPSPVEVPVNERTAIFRAAGFVQRGDEWRDCGGDGAGSEIAEYRDLNGDGKIEAMVKGFGSACHGRTSEGFVLLTRQGSGWRKIAESTGIARLISRPGLSWPDIEIGGAGSACFPFMRWDGRAYVEGGTSIDGKMCTVRERFVPSARDALAQTTDKFEFGLFGRVPMRLGYYVNEREQCSTTTQVDRFLRDEHRYISFDDKGRARVASYPLDGASDPRPDGEGFYNVSYDLAALGVTDEAAYLEEDPHNSDGFMVRPVYPGTIERIGEETYRMKWCSPERIPAGLRR